MLGCVFRLKWLRHLMVILIVNFLLPTVIAVGKYKIFRVKF